MKRRRIGPSALQVSERVGRRDGEAPKSEPRRRGTVPPAPSASEREMLDALVASFSGLNLDQLRLQWRNHLGGSAPAQLPGWLLMCVLAYRIQAAAFGDLDRAILRRLREPEDEAFELGGARPFATRGDDRYLRGTAACAVRRGEGWDCLKIVGFLTPMRDRSFRDARQAHQPIAPAHDRRHDGAPVQGEGAERLRPARQNLRGLSRPFAGHRHERGPWPLSGASGAAADRRSDHQRRHRRAPVLFQRDARTPRPCPSSDDSEQTA